MMNLMLPPIRFPLTVLLFLCLTHVATSADEFVSLPKQQLRTWTSRGGNFTVEATLLEVKSDAVLLNRQDNGKTITVQIEKLSAEDQAYLQQFVSQPVASGIFLSLSGQTVKFGLSKENVIAVLGKPQRQEISMFGLEWFVYHADYTKFMMIAFSDNTVCGLYTNAKGFRCGNGIEYGGTSEGTPIQDVDATVFRDQDADNTAHAVLLISTKHRGRENATSPTFLAVQARECFDATNAFRVNHGRKPLTWDNAAALTATKHSRDMATNNYFSHTSQDDRSMTDRFAEVSQRKWNACGENIAAGNVYGISAFDGWVNSPGHRENMLNDQFQYLGVGSGYHSDSDYRYYMTQLFMAFFDHQK